MPLQFPVNVRLGPKGVTARVYLEKKNVQPLQAIIFDLDGVIIDSEPLHEASTRAVFERYGLDVPDYIYEVYKGKTDRDLITHVIKEYGGGSLEVDRLVEDKQQAYRDLISDLKLVPGADRFIRAAAEKYPLALTTSAAPQNQRLAFEKFNLSAYFKEVITAHDITHPKPDPEPYTVTAGRLGLEPGGCLVIEDSVNGVISGVAAGCMVAGLTTSFDVEALLRAGAHRVVGDYESLAAEIGLSLS